MPEAPFLSLGGALKCAVAIVFSVIRVSPVQSAVGAALMVAGVPAFYYWKRRG